MKLFYVPGVCSLSPHIVLREMGADFKLDKVDRNTKISESGTNYNQLNPKSYVPALQLDDGSVLTEGASILLYLADQVGGEKVAPKPGTKERYKLQEWLVFIATEIHKNFSPLFRNTPDPTPRETLQKRLDLDAEARRPGREGPRPGRPAAAQAQSEAGGAGSRGAPQGPAGQGRRGAGARGSGRPRAGGRAARCRGYDGGRRQRRSCARGQP